MLALAGRVADGTMTWMTGPKTHPRARRPRASARRRRKRGGPSPRIVVSLPIAVTDDVAAARAAAGKRFAVYGSLPSYRAMLDREGAAGPGDVAIVGDEASVLGQLETLAAAGATEFGAAPFPVGGDRQASIERTRATLLEFIKRHPA